MITDKLYSWCLRHADTRYSQWVLFLAAFADAALLPFPTPLLFFAVLMLNRSSWARNALFTVAGLQLGTLVGYSLGYFAWLTPSGELTEFARFVLSYIPGITPESYSAARALLEQWDVAVLATAMVMPAPQTAVTILSGVFGVNLAVFIGLNLAAQCAKYFALGWLINRYGERVKKLLSIGLKPIAIAAAVCLSAAILLYTLL